ncbi:MAG TPA: ISKra4 family transposase, partial [Candidatus Scalindua sp.]|nr:ISKra4 family transposase [Candidatus Scalindua sp.]
MKRNGYTQAEFNSVFTDHKVPMLKQRCTNKLCDGSLVPSIRSIFGTTMHPDLAKLQCEMGAEHTYRAAQNILNKKASSVRRVNNHERVHHVVESVGQYISDTIISEPTPPVDVTSELILQVDGGHLKDKNPEQRSFEAMTAVAYRPGSVLYSIKAKDHRGKILNKHCAASALSDDQQYMKAATLIAVKKQGLDKCTHVSALCDGATNCWNIVNSLEPHCASITRILDWFHIAMKFKNIAIPDDFKEDYSGAKWSLWHGKPDAAIEKLKAIKQEINGEKTLLKIEKLITYINNNKDYIVCYENRKNKGLTFTSHFAESTVESLINQRCK